MKTFRFYCFTPFKLLCNRSKRQNIGLNVCARNNLGIFFSEQDAVYRIKQLSKRGVQALSTLSSGTEQNFSSWGREYSQ